MKNLCLFLILFNTCFVAGAQIINTVAGGGTVYGDGGPATLATLSSPYNVAVDKNGNMYISDIGHSCIRKVSASGVITTFAGTGTVGFSGMGGPATAADLCRPYGVAVDKIGNVYFAEHIYSRVCKVDTFGIITVIAGTGSAGFSGDGGPAVAARLNKPYCVAVDTFGNVFVTDMFNLRVRKINTFGAISTVAGTGDTTYNGDDNPGIYTNIKPLVIAADEAGNVYFTDFLGWRVRKLTPAGDITNIAGTGVQGFSGDGGNALAANLDVLYGIAVDKVGNVYVADHTHARIRNITPGGTIRTIAGTVGSGITGDGGPAVAAQLCSPMGLCVDENGKIYVADPGVVRIRAIDCTTPTMPATITGPSTVCIGSSITLANTTPSGAWVCANTTATVDGMGVVAGMAAGTADIYYVVTNSCRGVGVSKTVTIEDCGPSVVPTVPLSAASVYPNPSAGRFTLALPYSSLSHTVTISDIAGRKIEERSSAGGQGQKLEFNLNKGIYFIEIATGREKEIKKIVVE